MANEVYHDTDDVHSAASTQTTSIPHTFREIHPGIWAFWLTIDWAQIVAGYVVYATSVQYWWSLPLLILFVGTRQHALGLLGHDATHRLAMKSRWWNDFLGEVLIGWPLLIVIQDGYRPWHFSHHRSLGSDLDPELDYRGGRPYQGKVSWLRIGRCFLYDLCGLGVFDLLNFMRLVLPYRRPVQMCGPVLMWITSGIIFAYYGSLWILGVWFASLVTSFWAVFRVRAFTEHVSVPANGKETSHRFNAGPLTRFFFFPHNTWCHYEHHKWPQVPFYKLPELRKLDETRPILKLRELFPLI